MTSTAIDFPDDRSQLDPAVNPDLPDPATGPLENGDIFIAAGTSYVWRQDVDEPYGRWRNEDPGATGDGRYVLKNPSGDQVIDGAHQLSINDNIKLEGLDGSAEFSGAITTNSYMLVSGSSNPGFYLQGGIDQANVNAADNYNNYIQTEAGTGDLLLTSQHLSGTGAKRDTKIKFVTQSAAQAGSGAKSVALTLDSNTGNATFAGAITLGAGLSGSDGSYLYPGSLSVRGDSLGDSNSAFAVFRGGNSPEDQTASIAQDGSASFAGNVFIGDDCNISGTDGSANFAGGDIQFFDGGAAIFNGAVNVYRDTGNNAGLIVGLNGANKTVLKADGSAEFEKGIWVSKTERTAYLNCSNYGPGDTAVITVIGAGGGNNIVLRAGGNIDANNVTFKLEPDNDANYTATTDSEGNENRVYNGPTLDVKDRLQNLIARLDALEADEISDDAASSALLTLIASLTARIDARDAVITDLTTRIQTLEANTTPAPTPQPTPTPAPTNLIPDEWSHIEKLKALKELISEMNL